MIWQGYGYYNQDETSAERDECGLLLFVLKQPPKNAFGPTMAELVTCMSYIHPNL